MKPGWWAETVSALAPRHFYSHSQSRPRPLGDDFTCVILTRLCSRDVKFNPHFCFHSLRFIRILMKFPPFKHFFFPPPLCFKSMFHFLTIGRGRRVIAASTTRWQCTLSHIPWRICSWKINIAQERSIELSVISLLYRACEGAFACVLMCVCVFETLLML